MKVLVWLALGIAVSGPAVARPKLRPEHLEPIRVELPAQPERKAPAAPAADRAVEPESRRKPTGAKQQYTRGTELYVAGQFTEAVAAYKEALAIDPGFAPAHRGLGYVYQRSGLVGKAIAELQRYLALAPGAADAEAIERRIAKLERGRR